MDNSIPSLTEWNMDKMVTSKPQTPIMHWSVYNGGGVRVGAFIDPGDAMSFAHHLGAGNQVRYKGGIVVWEEGDEGLDPQESRECRAEAVQLIVKRAAKGGR